MSPKQEGVGHELSVATISVANTLSTSGPAEYTGEKRLRPASPQGILLYYYEHDCNPVTAACHFLKNQTVWYNNKRCMQMFVGVFL